jgi:hypothetical protein
LGPQSPISPLWRVRELVFSLYGSPSMDAANHRSLVQTQFRERVIVPKLLIFQVKMNLH